MSVLLHAAIGTAAQVAPDGVRAQIHGVNALVHPPEAEPSSPQPETNQLAATPLTDLAGTAEAAEAFVGQVRQRGT